MYRMLIVAKMDPTNAQSVADVFAESDATELPHLVGVDRRTLLHFNGLYFQLVEAERDITGNLYRERTNPLFQDIHYKLAEFIKPYDPNWKEPKDAMANVFYSWSRDK